METSALYYISKLLNFNSIAIHNISDCTLKNKSLYLGRTNQDKIRKKQTQELTIPKILFKLLLNI